MTLLDPRVWIAAILLAAASFGLGYIKGNTNGKATIQAQWDKAKAEAAQVAASATVTDVQTGQQASTEYQSERTKHAEQIRVVRQTVVRTVTGQCFDADGLRNLNAAIRPVSSASAAR